MKDRVEQDELDYDTQQGQWKPSIFDHFDDNFNALDANELHGAELVADFDKWCKENNNEA